MNQNLPTQTRTIGEHDYTVTRLGFRDSRRLLETSEKILGPGVVALLSGVDTSNTLQSLLASDAATAVQGVLTVLGRLGSKDSDELFRVLAAHTQVDDNGIVTRLWTKAADNIDQWFALYPGECLLWLAFCFEVQYRDFFAAPALAIKDLLQDLEKKNKK